MSERSRNANEQSVPDRQAVDQWACFNASLAFAVVGLCVSTLTRDGSWVLKIFDGLIMWRMLFIGIQELRLVFGRAPI